jgi:drug/metabolite transporter (DMT)-like permease
MSSIGGAALFLGERLTMFQWIGTGLILMMVISLVVPSPREEQEVQK